MEFAAIAAKRAFESAEATTPGTSLKRRRAKSVDSFVPLPPSSTDKVAPHYNPHDRCKQQHQRRQRQQQPKSRRTSSIGPVIALEDYQSLVSNQENTCWYYPSCDSRKRQRTDGSIADSTEGKGELLEKYITNAQMMARERKGYTPLTVLYDNCNTAANGNDDEGRQDYYDMDQQEHLLYQMNKLNLNLNARHTSFGAESIDYQEEDDEDPADEEDDEVIIIVP